MKLLTALLVVLSTAALRGQEPRLPGPATVPSESEAIIQRARSLSTSGNHRESAAAWQTVATLEPVIAGLARRESFARGLQPATSSRP